MNSNELMKFIDDAPKRYKDSVSLFFSSCQRYWYLYELQRDILPVQNVLKNYSNGGQNRSKRRSRPYSLDIPKKLHIYSFWLMFNKHYDDKNEKKFREFIKDFEPHESSEILEEVFRDKKNITECYKTTTKEALNAFSNYYSFGVTSIDNLNIRNLFNAMDLFEEKIIKNKRAFPDLAESLNLVISQKYLIKLIELLETNQYALFSIEVAPIARALVTGETNSFTPIESNEKSNRKIFFAGEFDDNYRTLENKLNKSVSKYIKLWDSYDKTKKKILAECEIDISQTDCS